MYLFEIKFKQKDKIFYKLSYILGLNKNNLTYVFKKIGFSKNIKFYHLDNRKVVELINTFHILKIMIKDDLKKFKLITLKKLKKVNTVKYTNINLNSTKQPKKPH